MKVRRRAISIKKIPAQLDLDHRRALYRELENLINVDRPAVILDCSLLAGLDRRCIHLFLYCLEEAMKRNGDVRLAALQTETRSVLESTGLDTIFQVFESIADAVESFRIPSISVDRSGFSTVTSGLSTLNQESTRVNAA